MPDQLFHLLGSFPLAVLIYIVYSSTLSFET